MSSFLQISAVFRLIILLCFVWSKCVICCDKEENLTYQGITNIIIIIIIIEKKKLTWFEEYNWNYKNFDKKIKKNNKKSKEKRPKWNHYYHWKNTNHKLDLKNQIASHKKFDKRAKKKQLRN
jgi:hypothetical protein